jgi:PIN domain nuclease of toxin-antitoxin system
VRRAEPVALSAALQASPVFHILPLTYEVATEAASLANPRDPADRAIVATARVHRLRLVTSDQRIIESKLVPVIV